MKLPGFKEFLSQYDSKETKRAYKRDIKYFFNFCKKKPKEVGKLQMLSYLNHLKKKDISARSIARMFSSVRSYFAFLVSIDELNKNPAEKAVRLPKIQRGVQESVTDKELLSIFSKINKRSKRGARDYAILCIMLYNGLRRSEVCKINRGDIVKTENGLVLRIEGKGNKERIIPLHPSVKKAIIGYLKTANKENGKKSDPVFFGNESRRMTPHSIWKMISRRAKEAKIEKKIHPHMLRARFISLALESGVPITSVQEDAGHSSIETTAMYDRSRKLYERSSIHKIKSIEEPEPEK